MYPTSFEIIACMYIKNIKINPSANVKITHLINRIAKLAIKQSAIIGGGRIL